MEKHLWEVKHRYYCAEQNARVPGDGCRYSYDSFDEFLEEWTLENEDIEDYNLLFRWDWEEADKDDEDDSDLLKLFWMFQRIGDYVYCIVRVKKEDEERIIEYLKPRLEYMKALWQPLI